MNAIASKLESILETSRVVPWDDIEALHRTRIGQAVTSRTTPKCIVYPKTQEELASITACIQANKWRILPCGSGTKISWGQQVKDIDIAIGTKHLNRVIEHAVGDLTVTVEAGTKFSDIQALLAPFGQFLALDPAYPQEATIGGIVATADSGSLRQRYGGVRDMLLGITFVRADGQIAKAGGRVVKNVAGYDLMKLFASSYGTLGIICQVTFRVYPIPPSSGTLVLTGEAVKLAQLAKTLFASALTPTAVDLISTQLVKQAGLGEGMGAIARFQSVEESVKEQSTRLLQVGQQLGLQGSIYSGADEAELWQKLEEQMWEFHTETNLTCKIGVLPTAAATTITQMEALAGDKVKVKIHAGSGLGILRLDEEVATAEIILKMRSLCQSQSGYLTILEAPAALKQQIDVWGYTGNALDLMRKIKNQFDPGNILSPNRFVGGI